MKAYRIGNCIIAADVIHDARLFFSTEIGDPLPDHIEEMDWLTEVPGEDGTIKTIKAIVNETLDERNAWLRLGVPCDLYFPFLVARLP